MMSLGYNDRRTGSRVLAIGNGSSIVKLSLRTRADCLPSRLLSSHTRVVYNQSMYSLSLSLFLPFEL
jgi:radical SAM superfamily enzyme